MHPQKKSEGEREVAMDIRLQPRELDIPEADPFANDLLDRQPEIAALTNVLASVSGPSVIAINASRGMGKTVFLRMWAQHLRNEGFAVATFNAWRTDFANQPFIALASELTEELERHPAVRGRAPLHLLRRAVGSVVRAAPLPTARLVAASVPLIGGQLAQELRPSPSSPLDSDELRYAETKRAHELFRQHLGEAAAQVADSCEGRPLVLMIDELDRCRPSYAVELLETANHLFDVDRVVFVLALNREQLEHSVAAIYGERFDATTYAGRFFDLDYYLPEPDRQLLIRSALQSFGLFDLEKERGWYGGTDSNFAGELLPMLLDRPTLSLRQLLQTVHRLAAVVTSVSQGAPIHFETLSVLLVLRAIDTPLYQRFVAGNATDAEAIAAFGDFPADSDPGQRQRRLRLLVESTMCAGACLSSRDPNNRPDLDKHPHLTACVSALQLEGGPNVARSSAFTRSKSVVKRVAELCEYSGSPDGGGQDQAFDMASFEASIRQLELFPDRS